MVREGVLLTVVVAAAIAAGCGDGDEERAAAPTATATPEVTATATPTETPDPGPKRARSVRQCVELWNADALDPESYQVSANEFVAELAPVRVHVVYQRGHCYLVAPIDKRRIAIFSAARGRRPWSVPQRRPLKPAERVPYNARADREGRVTLD